MNPLRIRLRNVRTFVDLDLELPEGKLAILGENGAGKSTLATAVDWSLFGPDARSWAPYLTQGSEQTEMMIELQFEHDGSEYRIVRTFSGRGSGKATLDLFQVDGDRLEPLTRETAKETQALIEQTIGLSRPTFRASSMLVQGDGAAFTEAQPRDRKQILALILGLDRWDRYLAAARLDERRVIGRLEQIIGELRGSDEELEQRPEIAGQVAADAETMVEAETVGKAQTALAADFERELRELTQNEAARGVAVARVAQAEARLEPLRAAAIVAEDAVEARQVAAEELDTLPTPTQAVEVDRHLADLRGRRDGEMIWRGNAEQQNREHERIVAERARVAERIDVLGMRIDDLLTRAAVYADESQPVGEPCPHCGQPVSTPAARAHAAEALTLEAQGLAVDRHLDESLADLVAPGLLEIPDPDPLLDREIETWEQAQASGRQAGLQRARVEERIAGLDRQIAAAPTAEALKQAEDEFRAAAGALAALPAAADASLLERLAEGRSAAERVADAERLRWQAASASHARGTDRLERLDALAAKVEKTLAEREQLRADQDELEILIQAYGRDGIPAWIVSQVALPSIEAEACRILGELGTSFQVELRTLRATGAGEMVDALDVIVTTPDGERPYETFSGGERTRINLALRIALARLLATRLRGESRLLVIDEPEFLDADGTAALVQVIRGLADFDRVWLISHVPELRDAPLDGTIQVTRGEDGWSSVAVS